MPLFTNGQTALVTGAGSGIGRAVVLDLIREGVRQIIGADIYAAGLDETRKLAESISSDVRVCSIVCDITKDNEVDAMVEHGAKEFGRIDISVHCAGVAGTFKPTDELSPAEFDFVSNINFRGVWVTERAVLKVMKAQEARALSNGTKSRGSIVNITSCLGNVGMPIISPYVCTKHGIEGLAKADAIDYAKHDIRVNSVAPGFIGPTKLASPELWTTLEPQIMSCPMQRLGTVEEVSAAVSFLASDKASFITGSSLAVDGGYTCR